MAKQKRTVATSSHASDNGEGEELAPAPSDVEKQARRRLKEEAKLDKGARALLGQEQLSPEDWRCFREQVRLNVLYPGKFVAFRDHRVWEEGLWLMVRREVLCASRNLMVVSRYIQRLPEQDQRNVFIDRID